MPIDPNELLNRLPGYILQYNQQANMDKYRQDSLAETIRTNKAIDQYKQQVLTENIRTSEAMEDYRGEVLSNKIKIDQQIVQNALTEFMTTAYGSSDEKDWKGETNKNELHRNMIYEMTRDSKTGKTPAEESKLKTAFLTAEYGAMMEERVKDKSLKTYLPSVDAWTPDEKGGWQYGWYDENEAISNITSDLNTIEDMKGLGYGRLPVDDPRIKQIQENIRAIGKELSRKEFVGTIDKFFGNTENAQGLIGKLNQQAAFFGMEDTFSLYKKASFDKNVEKGSWFKPKNSWFKPGSGYSDDRRKATKSARQALMEVQRKRKLERIADKIKDK